MWYSDPPLLCALREGPAVKSAWQPPLFCLFLPALLRHATRLCKENVFIEAAVGFRLGTVQILFKNLKKYLNQIANLKKKKNIFLP